MSDEKKPGWVTPVVVGAALLSGAIAWWAGHAPPPPTSTLPAALIQGERLDAPVAVEPPKPLPIPAPPPVKEEPKVAVAPPPPEPVKAEAPVVAKADPPKVEPKPEAPPEPKPEVKVEEPPPVPAKVEAPKKEDPATAALPPPKHGEGAPSVPLDAGMENGYQKVGFNLLAGFRYSLPTRNGNKTAPRPDPFPAKVRALDGQKIVIEGYMLPTRSEKGKVREFLLSRVVFGCCFGDTPQATEFIPVSVVGPAIGPAYQVKVEGTLEVGEIIDDDGYLESVYRLKADRVITVEK